MPESPIESRPPEQAISAAVADLEQALPGQVLLDGATRTAHANTLTWISAEPPDAVVKPNSTQELADVIAIARRHRVPIIPFGGGTSLEGHVNAPFGGISVDLTGMQSIADVNVPDLTVRVGAGTTLSQLDAHLAGLPVFFSVDPGAGGATLGGMAATRASGTNTVRYGTMRENVQSLEVVMSNGRIIETATAAPKSAAGYDLTHLMIGSEGTLGVISALTLKLHPRPQTSALIVVGFASVQSACETVIKIMAQGVRPARIELLDGLMLRAINAHSKTSYAESPTLFVEFHSSDGDTDTVMLAFRTVAEKHGAQTITSADTADAHDKLWAARHDAFRALDTQWPGQTVLATDVCVPLSRLAGAISEAQDLIARLGLTAPIVGHVGDGNFHVLPVFDRADKSQCKAINCLLDGLVATAHQYGGTCTGEHGIGQGKIGHFAAEAGARLAVMQSVKRALDPANILNPGKIFTL